MKLSDLFSNGLKAVKSNAPEILTALGVSGVITTSYLTGKAAYEASRLINESESQRGAYNDPKERFKERFKSTWTLYIPAGVSGCLTVGCIVGAYRGSNRRTAAAVTAYSLTERAFTEYREKVVEQIGKGKEQKLRDELSQDSVAKNPPRDVVMVGGGHVLCYEQYTGRYFLSDMETLQKALNAINYKIVHQFYVSLEEFYDLIGLENTTNSSNLGWDSDRLLELEFSTVLSSDGRPCLAFKYSYLKPLK